MTTWRVPGAPGSGEPELFGLLRWHLGTNLEFKRTAASEYRCDVSVWDLIDDVSGRGRTRRLSLPVDLLYKVRRGGQGATVSGPGRVEVNHAVVEVYRSLGQQSQTALLPQLFERLTRIPAIHQVMTPLRAFVLELGDNGSIRPSDRSFRRYDEAKARRYLSVLQNLNYVKAEGDAYVPGARLEAAKTQYGAGADIVPKILADSIAKASDFMVDVLGWRLMVPYIRWSNAYYWKALEIEDLPTLSKDSWTQSHQLLYGQPTHGNPRTQIDDMVREKIVSYDGRGFTGMPEVFDPYKRQALAIPMVRQVLDSPLGALS